ncbi:hypothetical protein COSO111634_05255 [Corallococcus soli]
MTKPTDVPSGVSRTKVRVAASTTSGFRKATSRRSEAPSRPSRRADARASSTRAAAGTIRVPPTRWSSTSHAPGDSVCSNVRASPGASARRAGDEVPGPEDGTSSIQ